MTELNKCKTKKGRKGRLREIAAGFFYGGLLGMLLFILNSPRLSMEIHEYEVMQKPKYNFGPVDKYSYYIVHEAIRNNLDPYIIAAMMYYESSGDPSKTGDHGEIGLMQLKPQFHLTQYKRSNWRKPSVQVKAGSSYLTYCFKLFGSVERSVSCYNTGDYAARHGEYNAVYVNKVLQIRSWMKSL